jgi:hypothetical protein
MTCQEVNEYLDRSGATDRAGLPEVLRKHLEKCECCRALWELLSRRPCPRQLPQQVRSRIEHELLGSLEPVAPLPGTGKLALGFVLVFGGLSALYVALFADPGAPGVHSFSFATVAGVAAAVGLLLSLVLSREMAPGERRYVSPGLVQSSALAGLFAAVALVFPWRIDGPLVAESWHCFGAGFLMSLPAAGLALLLLRRGAVFSPEAVGAGAGLLAGLVGVLSLHFSCPIATAPHVVLGHVLIPVAGVGIGYAAGKLAPVRWSAESGSSAAPSSGAR